MTAAARVSSSDDVLFSSVVLMSTTTRLVDTRGKKTNCQVPLKAQPGVDTCHLALSVYLSVLYILLLDVTGRSEEKQ